MSPRSPIRKSAKAASAGTAFVLGPTFGQACASPDAADCLVVGVFAADAPQVGAVLPACYRALDNACAGALSQALAAGDLTPEPGATLMLHHVPGAPAARVLFVSLGGAGAFGARALDTAAVAAWRQLCRPAIQRVAWALGLAVDWPDGGADLLRRMVRALQGAAYRFDGLRAVRPPAVPVPAHVALLTTTAQAAASADVKAALAEAMAVADGMRLARDLGNLPGNVCTPAYLARQAQRLARRSRIDVKVHSRSELERLGMGAFLAVARGSVEAPKLIVVHYRGAGEDDAPVVLVGKGVTFDSGGISLKPGEAMDEMKFDMCGAAAVLGTMQAVSDLRLKRNVIGIVAACENMPAGDAYKPGDVIRSLSGQTIEILNTDAEGRLLLCDALTYAARFKPRVVIDVATLTGACVMALGHHRSGLFANDDALAAELLAAGETSGDLAWRLPLDDAYAEMLKSPVADVANLGGRLAGAITAACFLARFAGTMPWAHLDVAGTASRGGPEKAATGRPVPLLVRYLFAASL